MKYQAVDQTTREILPDGDIRAQVAELERCLASLKVITDMAVRSTSELPSANENTILVAEIREQDIRGLLKARASRERYFGPGLFSDPAWDMLLELFACELAASLISVSSLCIASNAPPSTAMRHIQHLERDGWIVRRPDPEDGRRYWMELSEAGSAAIRNLIGRAWPSIAALTSTGGKSSES